jgi:hypothetical protein
MAFPQPQLWLPMTQLWLVVLMLVTQHGLSLVGTDRVGSQRC